MICTRCGSTDRLEEHHIIQRVHGGGNEAGNKEYRCRSCHKYEHTKRGLEVYLSYERGRGQPNRISHYEYRLEVLLSLNTPELILERGTYISYRTDNKTHYLPRRIPTKDEVGFDRWLDLLVEGKQGVLIDE